MTDSLFDAFLPGLIGREGAYSDDKDDRGGKTAWGITEFEARAFGFKGDMRALDKATAAEIYEKRYYIAPGFQKVASQSTKLAVKLLDTGINMGPATAGMFLQRALNLLNNVETAYPDVTVDGRVGDITLACLRKYLAVRGGDGERVLLDMIRAQQAVRYMEIAERDKTQEKFEYGWQAQRAYI